LVVGIVQLMDYEWKGRGVGPTLARASLRR